MSILESINQSSVVSALVYLCLAAFSGILIGKPKIKGIGLGIAGVLFTGIIVAHFGGIVDHEILHFTKEFGLILFVFSIGMEVGPRFLASIKKQGLLLNILASSIVFLGVGVAFSVTLFTDLPKSVIAGILCGAVTNTPGLGAAQQALTDIGMADQVAASGTGYAIAYPFGIMGIILTMILIRLIFKISIPKEVMDFNKKQEGENQSLESIEITINNDNLFGKQISFFRKFTDNKIAISRIKRKDDFIAPRENTVLEKGDIIYGVTSKSCFNELELSIGTISIFKRKSVDGKLAMKDIIITKNSVSGKNIDQLGIYRRYPANITRIFRSGMEIMPTLNTNIEFGDTIRIVGESDCLKDISNELGNSRTELAHPNIIPIFMGIFFGVIIGSIPFFIPGLPAPVKLGLAGGPLLVALYLGHKGRIGKMHFYITPGANLILREVGITLFLACVGLGSGATFWESLINGGYMYMLWGALITFIPLFIVGIISRIIGYNYLTICGLLAGAMTDPPALGFANELTPSQAQGTAYATVYPLVMVLRIMTAQIFVFLV